MIMDSDNISQSMGVRYFCCCALLILSFIFIIFYYLAVHGPSQDIQKESEDRYLQFLDSNEGNPPSSHNDILLKQKILQNLIEKSFIGSWNTEKPFANFINRKGMMRLVFQRFHHNIGSKGYFYNYNFFIHDGDNKDHWVLVQNSNSFSIADNQTQVKIEPSPDNLHYNYTKLSTVISVGFFEFKNFNVKHKEISVMNLTMSYISDDGMPTIMFPAIKGSIVGEKLSVEYEIKSEVPSLFNKISDFSVFISFIGFFHIIHCKHLLSTFNENESKALLYSPFVFIINIVWNAFVAFECFLGSLYDDRLFNSFILPTVIYLVIFLYFDIKIIFIIWKTQIFRLISVDIIVRVAMLRRLLLKFYIFCYIMILIILLYTTDLFFWEPLIYFLTSITWIPQIYHNLKNNQRKMISSYTIVVISCNQILIPLYFRMCPNNFFDFKQDMTFSIILLSLMGFQVFILVIQRCFRLRCLIPRVLLPKQHNYMRTIVELQKLNFDVENLICSICLVPFIARDDRAINNTSIIVHTNNNVHTQESNSLKTSGDTVHLSVDPPSINRNRSTLKSIPKCLCHCLTKIKCKRHINQNLNQEFMITPCKHLFHAECLKAWIDLKSSCPQCRGILPPLVE